MKKQNKPQTTVPERDEEQDLMGPYGKLYAHMREIGVKQAPECDDDQDIMGPAYALLYARMREIGIKQAVQCPEHLSHTFFANAPGIESFEISGHVSKNEPGHISYTCELKTTDGFYITVSPGDWFVRLNTGWPVKLSPSDYAYVSQGKKMSDPTKA